MRTKQRERARERIALDFMIIFIWFTSVAHAYRCAVNVFRFPLNNLRLYFMPMHDTYEIFDLSKFGDFLNLYESWHVWYKLWDRKYIRRWYFTFAFILIASRQINELSDFYTFTVTASSMCVVALVDWIRYKAFVSSTSHVVCLRETLKIYYHCSYSSFERAFVVLQTLTYWWCHATKRFHLSV